MTRKIRPEIAKWLGVDPKTPVRSEIEQWLKEGRKRDETSKKHALKKERRS